MSAPLRAALTALMLISACGDGFVPQTGGDDMGTGEDLPTSGPCAGVSCGPGGRCVELDAAPSCACDEGYIPQGLSCVMAPAEPAIVVNVAGAATTTEAGGKATLTIQLSRQPTHAVTIPLKLSATAIAQASAAELIFIPESWSTPQTVTITGKDDGVSSGQQTYFVLLGPAVSQDAGFMGLEASATLTSQDTRCGDGVKNGPEQCDEPGASQQCAFGQSSCTVCDSQCALVPGQPGGRCGDGVKNGAEQCDGAQLGGASCPAGTTGAPSCSASCTLDTSACEASAASVWVNTNHSCAITPDKKVYCWGQNAYRETNAEPIETFRPVALERLPGGADALAVGSLHICALTPSGGVKCWGNNSQGQLGDGTTTDALNPVDVVGLSAGVKAISAGHQHTCALLNAGAVKCWGDNLRGQLGDGTTTARHTPTQVTGLSGVQSLSVGNEHTCALTTSGGVKCWGDNSQGQLGKADYANASAPADVMELSGARAIAAGKLHSCAILNDNTAWCWGGNGSGQLGNGTTDGRSWPSQVVGLRDAKSISAGAGHTCVVTTAGGIKCWGGAGLVGDGSNQQRTTPVDVSGLSAGVKFAALGDQHACAVLTNGSLRCWGANYQGPLGDGTTDSRLTPTRVLGFK